ncbi:hypothetical protein FRX31_029681 [Thalictrum thalictroides]|uniref:Uncharacterized protein n=1 Tax=Thalictrum thalictroides TaxID=46969 RepID=A0A7J6V8P1_THATH|nr:hypothetical protein FRX31_029681 [Thalictrum thalictroides]
MKGQHHGGLNLRGFQNLNLIGEIEKWWSAFDFQGSPSLVWWLKMKALKVKLKKWNEEIFGRLDKQIQELSEEIQAIELGEEAGVLTDEMKLKKENLNVELKEKLR